jgi:hypothetical protein
MLILKIVFLTFEREHGQSGTVAVYEVLGLALSIFDSLHTT